MRLDKSINNSTYGSDYIVAYIRRTCRAGKTVEIEKYYSYRAYAKGEKRAKREKPTPESMRKANQRRAEKELRRLMNANFQEGDYLITLTYRPGNRPENSREMQRDIQKFIRRIRKAYERAGAILKYIYVKEIGKRGAAHVHIIVTAASVDIGTFEEAWQQGAAKVERINNRNYGEEPGQYRKIANYFIKYSGKTIETEGKLIGKRWYASQNLKKPEIKKEIISRSEHYSEQIKTPRGYHIEKESIRKGISDLTGYSYMEYTIIEDGTKSPPKEPEKGNKKADEQRGKRRT